MPVMDPDRHKDSGEMYSPDDQWEYMPLDEALHYSLQGLSDALADVGEGTGETSVEELLNDPLAHELVWWYWYKRRMGI